MEQKDRWNNLKREYKNQEKAEEIEELKEESKEMTDDEKRKIKKDIVMLLWIIGLIIIALVAVIVGFNKHKKTKTADEETIDIVTNQPLKNGEIDIKNKTIKEVNSMFTFQTINPLYKDNILKLYNVGTNKIEDLDFQTKMLFITSHSEFKKIMEEKGVDKNKKNITLTTKELEELSLQIFNMDINLEHQNFKYYYEKDEKVTYYDVILQDEKYIFNVGTGTVSDLMVYTEMYSGRKEDNILYIEHYVVFVNETGIYADAEMTKKISSKTTNPEKYIYKGMKVEFVYGIKNTGEIEYYFRYTRKNTDGVTPDYEFGYMDKDGEIKNEK